LKATAGCATAAALGGGGYWYSRRRVNLAIVGAGVRGNTLAASARWTHLHPVYGEIVAVCDVDRTQAGKLRDAHCPRAEIYDDYQRLLSRNDLDAVLVCTPDHWHAEVAAAVMRAGKAVLCEKPITHTIAEGKLLVKIARETGGMFESGLWQRHDWRFRTACELVRNGRLGKLKHVDVLVADKGLEGGPFAAQRIPEGLNWDRWLGPAPLADYCPERHHGWHYWQEYGGGEITNWGVHHLDIAHWAMDVDESGPLTIEGHGAVPAIENGYNWPRTFQVEMLYPNDVTLTLKSITKAQGGLKASGVRFEGEKGWIFVSRSAAEGAAFDELRRNPLPLDAIRLHDTKPVTHWVSDRHLRHFLYSVLTGAPPISGVMSSHRSTSACHLANISILLGRKLTWNAQSEEFVDDPDANAMLDRPRRSPYLLT
jgi:predicted dehydrogenase